MSIVCSVCSVRLVRQSFDCLFDCSFVFCLFGWMFVLSFFFVSRWLDFCLFFCKVDWLFVCLFNCFFLDLIG